MCGQPACWLPSKTENKNDIPFARKTILKDKPGDRQAEMAKAAAELAEVHGWERVELDQVKFIKPPEAPPAKQQKTEEEPDEEPAPAKEQKTEASEEQSASTPITPPGPTV